MALSFLGCRFGAFSQPAASPSQAVFSTLPAEGENWYSVFWSPPDEQAVHSLRGGADQYLADAIQQARLSVDVAVLRLNLWSIRDALLRAHRRGVTVRLVTDNEYFHEKEVQQLVADGIPVVEDGEAGLMHDKFVIIDRLEVWTGSMNLTVSDAYRNDNHLVRIRSTRLAENYTREFEEMFLEWRFGRDSVADTPHPALVIEGIQLENYFSPDDGVADRLVELVHAARESIYFLAYSFTSAKLADALLERLQAGVRVAGVMEASQAESNTGTQVPRFIAAGMDLRLDGNPGSMHHKLMVIDRRYVVCGSYNFTQSAESRNDENILIIDDPGMAGIFLAQVERIYATGEE